MSDSMDERLIPPKAKRGRSNESEIEEENKDWFSELSDCILLQILSFLEFKTAVQTCVLSSRWKDLWKCLPILTLHSSDFSTYKDFNKIVSKILTLRDGSISLEELDFEHQGIIPPHLIKRVINYAVSHNVQRLKLDVTCDRMLVMPRIFTCHTLTSLKLTIRGRSMIDNFSSLPESLNLPELTTLYLRNFKFSSSSGNDRADPFSAFKRLHSLTIEGFSLPDARILCISSATLVNLSICNYTWTPRDYSKVELSTPCLHRLTCYGNPTYYLCGSGLSSVKEVYIDTVMNLTMAKPEFPLILLSWLQNLVDMISLTVTTNTLQVLFLVPDFLKIKLPTLANLKIFKIKKVRLSEAVRGMVIKRMERQMVTTKSRIQAIRLVLEIGKWKARNEPFAPLPEEFSKFLDLQVLPFGTKVETIYR